jgi:hypothetical protein
MSLLDNLGTQQASIGNKQNMNIASALNRVNSMLNNMSLNPRQVALNMMRNNGNNKNKQLLDFLHQNGVNDEQLNELGIKL